MITYSAVICACVKCGRPERAFQLFDEMQRQGLEPNAIAYTAVINAGEPSLQIFDVMQQQGTQANWIAYSAVVSACRKCEMP